MDMDEEAARTDIQKLQELLDHTASKSKKQKEKAEEYCITFDYRTVPLHHAAISLEIGVG